MAQSHAGRTDRRRCVLACAILALAVGAFVISCGVFMGEDALVARAAKEREAGDLRAAMLDLKKALQRNPRHAEARFALGEVALQIGDYESAAHELEIARDAGIGMDRVGVPLARAYLSGGRVQDTLRLIRAPGAGPHRPELLAIRGVALLSVQRRAEARESFELALQSDARNIEALMGLATVSADTEGLLYALALADSALQADPADPRVRILRGQLQLRAKAPALARREFEQAAQDAEHRNQGEQRFIALAGEAEAAIAQMHTEDSLAITQRMVRIRPEHPLSRFMRSQALLLAGRAREARPLLEKNVSQYPDASSSRLLLGAIALVEGACGQAEMYLASVVAAEPGNVVAREWLATARLRQRPPAEALQALLPAVTQDAPSMRMLASAGEASIAAGETSAGRGYLEHSAKAQSDNNAAAQLDPAAESVVSGQTDRAAAPRRLAGELDCG